MQNPHDMNPNTNLNDSPYFSEQNGFLWATNHNGSPEGLPPHIKRIVNDEVERQSNPEWYEESLRSLHEEKSELEEKIQDCDIEIHRKTQELATKEENLAELDT